MKLLEKEVKEFNELQELIATIEATAKLIGYKTIHDNKKIYFYIGNKILPHMEIKLILRDDHTNILITLLNENFAQRILDKHSHGTKVTHLNNLLQAL